MKITSGTTPLGRRIEVVQSWPGKRAVDIFLACLLLGLLSPAFLFISIAVKLTSRGPVFYRDPRLGYAGRVYAMLKFRSMRQDAPPHFTSEGKLIIAKSDPRLTPIGQVLRQLHLDELPQLVNVLKGDMSLVGPRSGQPGFEHLYNLDAYERLRLRPGITGLGAIVGGRFLENTSLYSVEAAYIRQQSPHLDLLILLLTPVYVFFGPKIPRALLARHIKGLHFSYLGVAEVH